MTTVTAVKEESGGHVIFLQEMAQGLFPFYCLGFGLLIDTLARLMNQPILSTVILLILGFSVPQSAYYLMNESQYRVQNFVREFTWADLNSHAIMFALLPILIFESAFSIEAHEFGKHFWEIIILAGPCFVGGFLFLAAWMYPFVNTCLGYPWTFNVCLLYSATISATDPVAVVMLLSKLGVPHRLRLLIEGESLLNDGVAIVLYNVMLLFVRKEVGEEGSADINAGLQVVIVSLLVALSVAFGILFGRLTGWVLGRLKDTLRERAIILLFVYLTYALCETTKGSGVLGVVTYALILNSQKEQISTKSSDDNQKMWQFLAYWANWILFPLTGLMSSETLHKSMVAGTYGLHLLSIAIWAYVGCFVCRFLSLAIYALITRGLSKISEHWYLPWSYVAILTWGGLRGSIALLLAMQMANEKLFESFSPPALVAVVMTVLISNFIHTLTAKYVCDRLDLIQGSIVEEERMRALLLSVNRQVKPMLKSYLNMDAYFWAEADWERVKDLCTLEVPPEEDHSQRSAHSADVDYSSRLIVNNVMGAYVRALGEKETLSRLGVQYLVNAINEASDHHTMLNVPLLYKHLQPFMLVRQLSAKTKLVLDHYENWWQSCKGVKAFFIGDNVKLTSDWWQFICHILVFTHCCLILWTFFYYHSDQRFKYNKPTFQYLLYLLVVLCILLCLEILIRLWLARDHFRHYMRNRSFWRLYDFLRVITYLLAASFNCVILKTCFTPLKIPYCRESASDDVTTSVTMNSTNVTEFYELCLSNCMSLPEYYYIPQLHALSLLLLLSLIYALFWLFYLVPRLLITELHDYTVKADNLTLETFHGIMLLAEHVQQRLEGENRLLFQQHVRIQLEKENLQMKQEAEAKLVDLLNVQTANSRRIGAIKTRNVSRMILGESVTALELKWKNGEISNHEFQELEKNLSSRIQLTLQLADSKMDEVELASRLKLIPWIRSSKRKKQLIAFICKNSQLKNYAINETLVKEGEVVDGAYFLMSGICQFYKINKGKNEKLSLLYSGRFIGERAFLEIKSTEDVQKRSGSVIAATSVSAYFLSTKCAPNVLKIDPDVAMKFEEVEMALQCKDFLRLHQPYCLWTVSALDGLIQHKLRRVEREEVLPGAKKGASYVLVKGDFEIDHKHVSPAPKQCVKHDGPITSMKVKGAPDNRCYMMELNDNPVAHSESDSDKTLATSPVSKPVKGIGNNETVAAKPGTAATKK